MTPPFSALFVYYHIKFPLMYSR